MDQKEGNPLFRFLTQRGLSICQAEPYHKTIHYHIDNPKDRAEFNRHFASYSYRIFVRDLISIREGIDQSSFGVFLEKDHIEKYLRISEALSLLNKTRKGTYSFSPGHVTDMGDTFEYHVAHMLGEMGYDVTWGVKFEGISSGGDFDILGLAAGKLFYIETKTSPPKHVEGAEISNFIERYIALKPDFGILLNDTHLRMKDKLVPLIEEDVENRTGVKVPMERLDREIFSLGGRVYLTNTKRDIGVNLRACVNDYFDQNWARETHFPG